MKHFFHRGANFGDALNRTIFDSLLPGVFDESPDELFIGIGSLLGLMPAARSRTIFSTGFAGGNERTYGTAPRLEPGDRVLCVRGPLTASALGLDDRLAVSDGALLLSLMKADHPTAARSGTAFMPHVGTLRYFDWESIVQETGITFIDPTADVREVMKQIQRSELLIAEAMHGAIVADTFGVPWIPVQIAPAVNGFKWRDWAASVGVSYCPVTIPMPLDRPTIRNALEARRWSRPIPNLALDVSATVLRSTVSRRRADLAARKLTRIATGRPALSSRTVVATRGHQLAEILEGFSQERFGCGLRGL